MSGTSRNISAPVDCWCVLHCFHIVDFPQDISKAFFPQTKPEFEEEKETTKTFFLEVIPKRITVTLILLTPEEGFVPGSSPAPAWTQLPWHCVWHQGSDTVIASLALCDSPNPGPSSACSNLLFFLETFCEDTLAMYHSPTSVDRQGVKHIQHGTI